MTSTSSGARTRSEKNRGKQVSSSTQSFSWAGRAYIGAVGFCGVAVASHSAIVLLRDGVPYQWAVFAALTLLSGRLTIRVPSVEATFAVSEIFTFSCVLLFGPEAGTLMLAFDALVLSAHRRMGFQKAFFNIGALPGSVWIAGTLFFAASGVQPLFGNPLPTMGLLIPPLTLMAATFYALNTGLISAAIAFEGGGHPLTIWRKHFLWLAPGYAASASVSLMLAGALQQIHFRAQELLLPLFLIPPLFLVFYSTLRAWFGRLEDARDHTIALNRVYLKTIETLATAIDAKDEVTHGHIRRVQIAAVGLARELGVTDEQTLKAIEAAALLHDTGKIAVPEHILNKPGKLTPAEFEKMKLHAAIGAEILSPIDFPYPVVPIVRHHHENWDGTGYPDGIKGTAIPIGARILSVVDCFDALTSDRPYRRRMPDDVAVQILLERRGKMYDPLVVDAFLRCYRTIMPPADSAADPAGRLVGGAREAAPAPEETAGTQEPLVAYEVLAVSSLARAVGGQASVNDIGALVWMLLRTVVPAAAMALFVADESEDTVAVRYATGLHAGVLRAACRPRGSGVAGWVAANRRAALNADPSLDLGIRVAELHRPLRSTVAVPLSHDGAAIGVLALYAEAPGAFSEDDLRLLDLIAPSLAAAVGAVRHAETAEPVIAPAGADSPKPAAIRLLRVHRA